MIKNQREELINEVFHSALRLQVQFQELLELENKVNEEDICESKKELHLERELIINSASNLNIDIGEFLDSEINRVLGSALFMLKAEKTLDEQIIFRGGNNKISNSTKMITCLRSSLISKALRLGLINIEPQVLH